MVLAGNRSGISGMRVAALLFVVLTVSGCAQLGRLTSLGRPAPSVEPICPSVPAVQVELYRRAETDRSDRLAHEIVRLKDDLRRAEEALVIAESDLTGTHSRADAVSSLAEARIQTARARKLAPWRAEELDAVNTKLDEADRQISQSHFGAAIFFVYRGLRIANAVLAEAERVYSTADTMFVKSSRVNLRAGPSVENPVIGVLTSGTPVFPETRVGGWVLVRVSAGPVGWVHGNLLAKQGARFPQSPPASAAGR